MHAAALLLTIVLTTASGRVTSDESAFEPSRQDVQVGGESLTVAGAESRMSETTETITLACGPACGEEPTQSRYGDPLCSDYALDWALIENADRGDRSAVTLMEQRYARAHTYSERHLLAGALLRKSSRDAEIWNELIGDAELVVRYPKGASPSEEYLRWCAQQGFDPTEHWSVAESAVFVAAKDPRSRALLHQLLEGDDADMIAQAIEGLGTQRDFTALPAIEQALQRLPEDAGSLALVLVYFADDRADDLARKYLSDDHRESYEEFRAQSPLDRER